MVRTKINSVDETLAMQRFMLDGPRAVTPTVLEELATACHWELNSADGDVNTELRQEIVNLLSRAGIQCLV